MKLTRITKYEDNLLPRLSDLLRDSVENGASIGFLLPLDEQTIYAYWNSVLQRLEDNLILWVAEKDGQLVGSVQLELAAKPNGKHRGEVQKLMVHSAARKQGVAAALLAELETFATTHHRTLLYLDTEAGSVAETVYQLGWQKSGEIPDFARSPSGSLAATAIYFKKLSTQTFKPEL